MKIKKKDLLRILTLFAIALTVFAVFCAFFCSIELFEHDCTGEDCPVCHFIFVCRTALKTLSAVGALLFCGFVFVALSSKCNFSENRVRYVFTPVSLGVRMND